VIATDAALLVVILLAAWSFYRAQRDPHFDFNAFDIIMEHGRVSRIACVFMAAFFVHSWIMIKLTFDGKMSEGYLTIYGATWVAPILSVILAGAMKGDSNAGISVSTVETRSNSTVVSGTVADDAPVVQPGKGNRSRTGKV